MKIINSITFPFDHLLQLIGHAPVRVHVEQDGSGIAHQSVGPARNDECADKANEWVHPKPPECTGKQQANDHEHRYGGISHYVNDSSTHVVIAVREAVRVFVFLEGDRVIVSREAKPGRERMWFGNFFVSDSAAPHGRRAAFV